MDSRDSASALTGGAGAGVGTAHVLAELSPELEVVRPLGRGSTSEVFLAREPALQRLVAVKVLRPELAADPIVRKRFEREAQSAARISHAHVTGVYRVGRLTTGVPYFVMEYVEGRTVSDIVEARGPLPPAEARALLESVASALAAAHDKGIIHRDVRPSNIYVEHRTGRAVLGDFGIAARLESATDHATKLTQVGVRLGQTRYMSPEQLRGDLLTEQSDVYSFGLLAYEVLAGRSPFDATTDAQFIVAHMTEQPKSLRGLRPDISAGWIPLIEHCLAKDPNQRPRARDLANALAAAASATSVHSAATLDQGPLSNFLEEVRRRRLYQVLVAYGAFSIAAIGLSQDVFDAFGVADPRWYRLVVLLTVAGFPAALSFGWVYDVSLHGIERTAATAATRRARIFVWLGLTLSVVTAVAVGWLLLRSE